MEKEVFKIYKETTHTRWGHRVYEVSNLGRVRLNGKIVEPYIHNRYLYNGSFYIHRAVAELFIPNPENKPYVDHINTDRMDNRAENLRWVTTKENCNNPLTKQHRRDAMKVALNREEVKHKISLALRGRTLSTETRKRMSESRKGKTFSEESRSKISAALKAHHNKLANEKEHTMKSENYVPET